jgi:hypothetical protein
LRGLALKPPVEPIRDVVHVRPGRPALGPHVLRRIPRRRVQAAERITFVIKAAPKVHPALCLLVQQIAHLAGSLLERASRVAVWALLRGQHPLDLSQQGAAFGLVQRRREELGPCRLRRRRTRLLLGGWRLRLGRLYAGQICVRVAL